MAITLGTEKQVSSQFLKDIVVANLTSTTAILAYYDNTATGNFTAVHMTLSAGVISLGTPVNTSSIDGSYLRGCKLSSTAAIFYGDTGFAGRAVVVTVSGTTLTINTVKSLTDSGVSYIDIAPLTSTKAIITLATGGNGVARILTVSGTTITENASFTYDAGARHNKLAVLSSTKAVVTYSDSANSFRPSGQVLDISGSTITGNTVYQLTTDVTVSTENRLASAALSSSKYIYMFSSLTSGDIEGQIIDEAATVLTPGTLQAIDTVIGAGWEEIVQLSATAAMAAARDNVSKDVRLYSLTISGTTITIDDTTDITVSGGTDIGLGALDATTTIVSYQDDITELIYAISAAVSGATGLAAMTKPASIDAAGAFIYVALLEGGTPILTKIATSLAADGATVFTPGAGTNIGVECGRFNSDVVWVAGNFDGTNVVELSADAGVSFTVADDATIGDVRTFVLGPDSDSRLLIFDETNGDILETRDSGTIWTTTNAVVTPEINAIARLGENVQEAVFGNDGGANNSINYSINTGDDLEDFQTGVYPNANATRVIVN